MKVVSLDDLSEAIDYGVTASADALPVGPKLLRITDIQNGAVDWNSVPYCHAERQKLVSARLSRGDIVFARTGATTGKSFLIRSCPDDAVFASYLIRVRPKSDVDPAYLAHFFDSPDYWQQISLKAAGAAQPGVNASKLKELKVPLPPPAEQKRIAAILDQADALRRLRRRALDRLNILGQAIFQEMIGEIRTAGGERYDRPSSLLEISDILIGYPFKSSNYVEGAGTVRLCRGANILPGLIDWSDLACYPSVEASEFASYDLDIGDVVVAMDRPWISSGFKVAQVNEDDLPSLLVQRVARIRARSAPDRDFIYFLLQNPAFQRHCKPTETTVPHISPKDFRSFKFILPPPKLRHAFGAAISGVRRNVAFARASGVWADALFQSLQHRAFTGQL